MENLNDLTIQQIVDRFKQFGTKQTVRLQQCYRRDQGNDLVPFVIASWGQWEYPENLQHWCPIFIYPNGNEMLLKDESEYENIRGEDVYQCFESSYDWDLKSILIKLYQNIYKLKHKEK